jgi:hypothetical protein
MWLNARCVPQFFLSFASIAKRLLEFKRVAANIATRDAKPMFARAVSQWGALSVKDGYFVTRATGISDPAYISSETCEKCKKIACSSCLGDDLKGDHCGSQWAGGGCGKFICFDCERPDFEDQPASWAGLCTTCLPVQLQTIKCGSCDELIFDCGKSHCPLSENAARLSKKYVTKGKKQYE